MKHIQSYDEFINESNTFKNEAIEIVSFKEVLDNWGKEKNTNKLDYIEKILKDPENFSDDMTFLGKDRNIYYIDDLIGKDVKVGNSTFKVEESIIIEAKSNWSKMMKGVRSGNKAGPWSIVAIKDRKVVGQSLVKIMDAIPAGFEGMKEKYPNAKFHIEDVEGAVVYNESVEFIDEAVSGNIAVFFYIASGTLTNIDTNKIFNGWKSDMVDEKLSREWVVYIKHIKEADKAQSIIDSIVKKFPRYNSITYQAGLSNNSELTLLKGSYRSTYIERWFEKTVSDLVKEEYVSESSTVDKVPQNLVQKEKYKKGDKIYYRVYFPASTMVANSKTETSNSVYSGKIDKVSKHWAGYLIYYVGHEQVTQELIIGVEQ